MKDYSSVSDEELIIRLKNGEFQIMDYILEKYKNLVRKRAKDMFLIGGDGDDLIQEGMIGLFKAVQDYQKDKGCSFFSFADLCISRQIYSAIQASNRMKHMPLNTYISLYAPSNVAGVDSEESVLIEQLQNTHVENPENKVIAEENVTELKEQLLKNLSKLELEVLFLYLAGNDYASIAKMTGKTSKSVDNALHRARGKIAAVMKCY